MLLQSTISYSILHYLLLSVALHTSQFTSNIIQLLIEIWGMTSHIVACWCQSATQKLLIKFAHEMAAVFNTAQVLDRPVHYWFTPCVCTCDSDLFLPFLLYISILWQYSKAPVHVNLPSRNLLDTK